MTTHLATFKVMMALSQDDWSQTAAVAMFPWSSDRELGAWQPVHNYNCSILGSRDPPFPTVPAGFPQTKLRGKLAGGCKLLSPAHQHSMIHLPLAPIWPPTAPAQALQRLPAAPAHSLYSLACLPRIAATSHVAITWGPRLTSCIGLGLHWQPELLPLPSLSNVMWHCTF